MIYWINIVAMAGLATVLAVSASHAGNGNPWSINQHNGNFTGGSAALAQNPAAPSPAWQSPSAPVQRRAQPPYPAPFGSDYVPLPGEQNSVNRPPLSAYQQPYQRAPGYPYGGGFSGQFGFGQFGLGMSMSPGAGFSGMPFGNGYPAMPYQGGAYPYGGNPYGGSPYGGLPFGGMMPFGGFNPWGTGFPMF